MPSGVPINPYSLRLIAFNIEHAILSIEELIQIIQVIDNVAEVTIRRHCSELSGFSVCKRKECVENSKKSSTGRPRLMDDADESFLMSIFKQKPFYRLRSIKILYNHLTDSHLSTSTLSRSLARSCFTLKKVHKESLLPDVNEQANFLDNIKYFEWRAFISVDETSGKRSKVSPTHVSKNDDMTCHVC
jgi:transposase